MSKRIWIVGAMCGAGACLSATVASAQTDPWATPSAGTGFKGGFSTAGQVSQKASDDARKAGAEAARATGYGVTHPGEVMSKSAKASGITYDETRTGFMEAAESPLRDLNMMQREIPAALVEAEHHPYDAAGLGTCKAITDQVNALDLALGPDVDTPNIEKIRDPYARSASFVANSALDAVKDATTHLLPGRNVVRRLSGANRYDRNVRNAILAGSVRRGFLKAYGMMHDCDWPAAPIGYQRVGTVFADAAPSVQTGPATTIASGAMVVTVATVTSAPATQTGLADATAPVAFARATTVSTAAPAGAWRIGRTLPGER